MGSATGFGRRFAGTTPLRVGKYVFTLCDLRQLNNGREADERSYCSFKAKGYENIPPNPRELIRFLGA